MPANVITTISPTTNKAIATRHERSPPEVDRLLDDATDAFRQWRQVSGPERRRIVLQALTGMKDEQDALAQDLTAHMGRPIAYAAKEITTAVSRGEYLVRISEHALQDTDGDAEPGFKRYITKEAVGVVLIIFAWNFPYLILINSLVPALLAGNAVVLKPSPQTPTVAEHVAGIFRAASLPNNVIQNLHCGTPALLEPLLQSPKVNLIAFTGSTAAGLAIQRATADRIVPVFLELGGKDPAYVRADVDIDSVATDIVDGAIFNSGQSCCSIERVYVADTIHDAFVAALQKVLGTYRLGDPSDRATQVGPVISKRAAEAIRAHIVDALDKGAIDVTPENDSFKSAPPEGNYVPPVLLINVTHQMKVMTEETFGPVIPVMKVTDDAEAVRLMNDSEYGLTASIWTKDLARGEALAREVEAGTVFVNRSDYPSPDLAWTGWKNSGKGVTLSPFGFEQFVKLKSYHVKDAST
ncbi:MAG: hypothetical protein M1826_004044 [Phylliscum demangeonii]|nr:MAG: hypothetical protein M1826_004044 [Phylliscum demangeonii]